MYDHDRSKTGMHADRHIVLGAGLIALDVILDRGFSPMFRSPGGTIANILSGLSFLGWETFGAGRMGRDLAGQLMTEGLQSYGVETSLMPIEDAVATPVVLERWLGSSQQGPTHSFVWRCPKCGGYLPRFRSLTISQMQAILSKAPIPDVFVYDRATPAILMAARHYKSKGTLLFFEPNSIGQEPAFGEALRVSDIVKYSRDRFVGLDHPPITYAEGNGEPWLVIETMGNKGLQFQFEHNAWECLDAYSLGEATDTCGAGDWCSVGFISRLLSRGVERGSVTLELVGDALAFGQALACINSHYLGASGLARELTMSQALAIAAHLAVGESGVQLPKPKVPSELRRLDASLCPICLR